MLEIKSVVRWKDRHDHPIFFYVLICLPLLRLKFWIGKCRRKLENKTMWLIMCNLLQQKSERWQERNFYCDMYPRKPRLHPINCFATYCTVKKYSTSDNVIKQISHLLEGNCYFFIIFTIIHWHTHIHSPSYHAFPMCSDFILALPFPVLNWPLNLRTHTSQEKR